MSHEHIRFDDHCTYRHTMVEPQPETQDAAYVGSLYGFPVFGEAPRDEMEAAAAADDLREVIRWLNTDVVRMSPRSGPRGSKTDVEQTWRAWLEHGDEPEWWLEPVDTTGILGRYGLAGLGLGRAAG